MSESNGQPDLKVFSTGAVRSKDAESVDYTLISPIALRAWAETCKEGAEKYKPLYCAEKGLPARDLLNHALKHIYDFLEGKRDEPDLPHALWNVGMAIHSLEMWPHLNQDLRREGCIPPCVDDETAASWDRLRENLERMKRDVREAAKAEAPAAPDIREGDHVTLDDGGFRVVRPSRKLPRRFYLASSRDDPARLRMAQYRGDLQWEGHEVVSRWIDQPGIADEADCLDFQSCDAVVIFDHPDIDAAAHVATATAYHKDVVVVGEFQDADRGHWYATWEEFLRSLAPARRESASAR